MAQVEAAPRFGQELFDSFKPVNTWVSNGIAWLEDQQQFYRERAVIEKEYSAKLSSLAKKYYEKKAKRSTPVGVGDQPTVTPGSLESSSLATWGTSLDTLEAQATEHERLAIDFQDQVSDPLKNIALRFEDLRKSYADYAAKLEKERDSSYHELRRQKNRYDGACNEVESRRKKTDTSFDHGKGKAVAAYQSHMAEMRNSKNTYLISIAVTNKLKERYYHQYVPELVDGLQDLAESRISHLNSIWTRANALEISTLSRTSERLESLRHTISQNQPVFDSKMFARHNLTAWREPEDLKFEPSPIWHDDDVLTSDEASVVYLRNFLGKSKSQARELRREVDKKRKDVDSLRRSRIAVREGKEKRDEFELVRSLISLQETLHDSERQMQNADTEITTIVDALGDVSIGAQNHKFKAETFKIPTNCDLCGERIWGLSAKGFDCQDCGFTCHNKCELKVPASCPGEQTKEERKRLKVERQASSRAALSTANDSESSTSKTQHLTRNDTLNTLSSGYAASANRSLSGSHSTELTRSDRDDSDEISRGQNSSTAARRNRVAAPPSTQYLSGNSLTVPDDASSPASLSSPSEAKGKMLFAYQATNDTEVTVAEGDEFIVAEDDDGSGWTSIRVRNTTGFVPTSYLEIQPQAPYMSHQDRPISGYSSSSASLVGSVQSGATQAAASTTSLSSVKKKGPAVAPRRSGKKILHAQAMYDYDARSDAEHSMKEGDKFILVKKDSGDGWADVEKAGIVKSVPANYIEEV